jgi:hypothetical protein
MNSFRFYVMKCSATFEKLNQYQWKNRLNFMKTN